ncbi:endospore germination permease [Radiobacillus kanasensis]|uniref:GerAB/ArcD/ProY family transporter n=1 Tax=Radiobacillus kanasensis TaxID=2844358 RepID=UPI001E397114|nr:endospore germination permease [Radiobacillus kanasensis]UFT99449.1 endospore germination permease [Radiobacillus kanasensis]
MNQIGRLRARELAAMIILMVGLKIADTTPALLAQKANNAFWLIPIVSLLLVLPSLALLVYLLNKYEAQNFIEVTEKLLGKICGKVIGFIIFFLSFSLMTVDSRNYVEQINLLYFPKSPSIIVYCLFFLVCFLGAKRGFEAIGSTSWIVLPYVKFSAALLALLVLNKGTWMRVFPIFGSGWDVILNQGLQKTSLFFEFFLFSMAFTALKTKKDFIKGSLFGVSFVVLEMILFFFLYITIFDYKSIANLAFPFYEVTQYVNLGEYLTNVETFFMVFWLMAAFVRFIMFLYFTTWIFGVVFNIKEFEPLILPMAFFAVAIGIIPENVVANEVFYRDGLLNIISPFFICLPVVLWIVSLFRRDLKK